MPDERYFSMCEMGDGIVTSTVNITASTTAGTFDATRQRGSIRVTANVDFLETPPFVDAAAPTTIYTVAQIYPVAMTLNGIQFDAVNSTGTVIFRLRYTGSPNLQAEFWNGSSFTALGAPFAVVTGSLSKIAIKLVCGAAGSCVIHVGGVEVVSAAITSASCNNVAKCRFRSTSNTSNTHWSEMAGANFDLRDLIIRNGVPTGNSATNTAWTGDYLAIDEAGQDDTDLISSATADQRESYTKAAYTIPTGLVVDSLWVSGRGRVNGAGPTDAKYMLRSSAANYDSTLLVLGVAFESRQRYWTVDPATSVKFTQAGYNAVEFGVVSV